MARPLVLVFQELAAPQATPSIPDLNSIIVGPAYDLLDYPDDAASIQLGSTYGQADQPAGGTSPYIPPQTGTDAVTVLGGAYPAQTPGSIVDHDSVRVVLKYPRVVLGSTNALVTPVLGTTVKTNVNDQTLIELNSMVGTGFVGAGVRPGDKVILTSNALSPQTYVRTVASVGEPNGSGLVPSGNEKYLRISQNLPANGTAADQWSYDNSGVTGGELRIERELPIQEFVDPTDSFMTFPEPGTDKFVLKGGITLSVELTPVPTVSTPVPTTTSAARSLSYSQLYLSYRALRQNLQEVTQYDTASVVNVNGVPTVNGIGKIDARNPLAVGVWVALQNSGTAPIYAYGVSSDDAVGHTNAREALSTRQDLYCFVPLTQDINIHAAYKTEFDAMANPLTALADGVIQKFRVVIGSVPLPTATTIYSDSISGVAQQPTGAATGLYRTLSIAAASTGAVAVTSVLPGDVVTIGLVPPAVAAWQNRRGTHKVSHVNSSKDFPNAADPSALELTPGSSRWDDTIAAPSGDIEVVVKAPDGTVKLAVLAEETVTQNTTQVRFLMKNPTVVGGPYTISYQIVSGLTNVNVLVTGFAIVVQVNGTSHTAQNLVDAVNAHPVVSTLLTASVIANGGTVINGIVPGTDPVSGQTGAAASVTTFLAGIATITGLTGMTVSSVGRYLTLSGAASGGNNGTFVITEYVSATSVKIANAGGVAPDANNGAITWTEQYNYQAIEPVTGACTAQVVVNDDLFNRLNDTSALFITAGVKAGDTIEFPLDPNDYSPTAFNGRVISYTVQSVISENSLLIANGVDDTAAAAKELPHYFARDLPNRYLDNTAPNAFNYRVRRNLSKDDQVLALTTIAQSVRSKRMIITWSDVVQVSDLRNGALPRVSANTRTLAGDVPGYYIGCQVAGAVAGLPSQHGLTNLGMNGINVLKHSQNYFSERQLTRLSDGGVFVMIQDVPGGLPYCIHQLTTDPTALETGEFSVVKNVDFISIFFLGILKPFIGVYNVTLATQNEIARAIQDGAENLMGRTLDRIGPPLLSGTLTSIGISEFDASRIEVYFAGNVPKPLNTIGFHLVV